jgi:TonB family protein
MTALLIEWVLRATALAAVVWLVLKTLRIRSPRLERSAWLLVLAASWTMPLLMKLPAFTAVTAERPRWLPQVELVAASRASTALDWQGVVLWVLITISLVLVLRHSLGVMRWWRMLRAARSISVPAFGAIDLRATRAVSSPATVFSTILVPEDFESWPSQTQRAVVAHENAHVANKDFYVQWLAQLHRCVFWFSPLTWWLSNRLALLSEHISDDAALQETREPAAYAEVLLSFAARRATGSEQLVSMARARTLSLRIDRILTGAASAATTRRKICVFLAALLPLVGITGAMQANQMVLPKRNSARPLSQPMYPPASLRLGEHGTVVLKLLVLEDGSVADSRIDESSGYPDLDYAALYETYRWHLDPGTVEGVPTRMWGQFAVTFKLSD